MGIDAITLKKEMFELFVQDDSHTLKRVEKFTNLEKVFPSEMFSNSGRT